MRTFIVQIVYQNNGTGYERDHDSRVNAISVASALSKALRELKRKQGRRFAVREGSVIRIRVIVGATAAPNKEARK